MKAHLITMGVLIGLILFVILGTWFPQIVGVVLTLGLFVAIYLIIHFFVLAILWESKK